MPLPDLAALKRLSGSLVQLADCYRQSGDGESAQAALQMGLGLDQRLAGGSGTLQTTIQDIVGLKIQEIALGGMDPASAYDDQGQTVRDRLAELARRIAAVQELGQQETALLPTLSEQDLISSLDTLKHACLGGLLDLRVRDGVVRRLIGKWLHAGVLDRGQLSYPEEGTPQGGVISPLLANIYLHYVLDCWYVESVKPRMKGRTFLVRFADDFILGFDNKEDADKVYRVLFQRFEKYGLSLHAEKTRLVPFGRPAEATEPPKADGPSAGTFDFLGFTHYWGKSREGRWVIRRKTSRKRFGRSLKRVSQWCRLPGRRTGHQAAGFPGPSTCH